jgi:hypothetical protein
MAWFARRERPPALAGLEPGERILSWADTGDGVVAATPQGLWWPAADGPRRIPWDRIDKATWRDGVLSVIEADIVDDELLVDREPVRAALTVPRDLPPTVRKRVEGNIVNSELVSVADGAVRFVARRRPGRDGLGWWAHLEPGTPDTEGVRAAIRARLTILRSSGD